MSNVDKYVSSFHLDAENVNDLGETIRRNVILLNSHVLPDAPYFTFTWFYTETGEMQKPHTHDFDEIIGFMGSDSDDPQNLHGSVEFMIDGEWVKMEKTTVLYIPAGTEHCPYRITRVDRPILHMSCASNGEYFGNKTIAEKFSKQ